MDALEWLGYHPTDWNFDGNGRFAVLQLNTTWLTVSENKQPQMNGSYMNACDLLFCIFLFLTGGHNQ